MNLNEFKPNDIVKAMVSGCMNGTGRIMEVNENSVVFQWLEKEFACSCMHSADIFCTVTQHNIDNGDKLELMERPSADAKRLYFTETQVKEILELYQSNKEQLAVIAQAIEENGYLDDGTQDVEASFEQGYNNALEQVMSRMGIAFEDK